MIISTNSYHLIKKSTHISNNIIIPPRGIMDQEEQYFTQNSKKGFKKAQRSKKIKKKQHQFTEQPKQNSPLKSNIQTEQSNQKDQKQLKKQWEQSEKKLFFKLYLQQIIKYPLIQLSWNRWKRINIFSEMQAYFPYKNKKQIKSFDGRMKKTYFIGKGQKRKDIIDVIQEILGPQKHQNQEIAYLFNEYERLKNIPSQYMQFQIKNIEKNKEIIKQLQNIFN